MRILAIDPGLKKQAACFYEDGSFHAFFQQTSDDEQVSDFLRRFAGGGPDVPNLVVVEDQFSMNMKQQVGFIRGFFAAYHFTVVSVAAISWKTWLDPSFPKMKKNTKKLQKEYLSIMLDKTGIEFQTTDEADAYCIAKFVDSLRGYTGKNKCHQKIAAVLAGIEAKT